MATIYSCFPGIGKTFCHGIYPKVCSDSDSSKFSWLPSGERNPDFPNNYIRRIKRLSLVYPYVFVSSHKEVRDALVREGLKFTVVYPDKKDKQLFLSRYEQRESSAQFIELLEKNFDRWIDELDTAPRGENPLYVKDSHFSDKLLNLLAAKEK